MDSLDYIRRYYGVPAHVGTGVEYKGRKGVIVKGIEQYVGVLFDDTKNPTHLNPVHAKDLVYGEPRPIRRPTKSQARYARYLEYRDAYNCSFGDFLKYYANERG